MSSAVGTEGRHLPPGRGSERDLEQEAWRFGESDGRSPTFEQVEQRRRVSGCGNPGTVRVDSKTRLDFGPADIRALRKAWVTHSRPSSSMAATSPSKRSCARLTGRPRNRGIARGSSLHCKSPRSKIDRHVKGAPARSMCDLAAEKRESVAWIGE